MSKSAKIIAAKPHTEKKVMQKKVTRRFAQIERKVQAESNPMRDAMRYRMMIGRLYMEER